MGKFSRRELITGASALALAAGLPHQASAIKGSRRVALLGGASPYGPPPPGAPANAKPLIGADGAPLLGADGAQLWGS
jgi:hypothetical protein